MGTVAIIVLFFGGFLPFMMMKQAAQSIKWWCGGGGGTSTRAGPEPTDIGCWFAMPTLCPNHPKGDGPVNQYKWFDPTSGYQKRLNTLSACQQRQADYNAYYGVTNTLMVFNPP